MRAPSICIFLLLKCVGCLAMMLVIGGTAMGAPPPDAKGLTRGKAIKEKHKDKLGEMAVKYHKSEEELGGMLDQDDDLYADAEGRLLYLCENQIAEAPPAGEAPEAGPFPGSETFFLHSRAGATKVIYLDFNGHTTSGTIWNSQFENGQPFTTPAYDTDGNPGSFTTAELDAIQVIWQQVAEDFAPFEVDVTTQDPGVEALRNTAGGDTAYGVRVVIGGSSSDWFGSSAGGVAYVGSFNWSSDTPCFVFKAQLTNGFPKYVAEACSHEAGHTLGLSHDGASGGVQYYAGHNGWAPIMGVGYYVPLTQWSKGEYTNANNTEDDLAVMQNYGISYRLDDHSSAIVGATPLEHADGTAEAVGVVESDPDADLFSFSTAGGSFSATATGAVPSPNLDLKLSLYDGYGTLISSSNPSGLDSILGANLEAGTYYLGVEGVGTGSPVTGYSEYASLGQFSLAATYSPTDNEPPVAVVTTSGSLSGPVPLTVNFSSAGSYDLDGSIAGYDWDFGDGGVSTLADPSHTYTTPGTYLASLVVRDNLSGSSAPASVTIVVDVPFLPAPWQTADIGIPGATGWLAYEAGDTFSVTGAGAGFLVNQTSDNFHFVYQPLTADGSITVRLPVLQNTGTNARVGVAIRETLAPNSKSTFMGVAGNGAFYWISRSGVGGKNAKATSGTGLVPNIWLRLLRKTDGTIEGYKSIDGLKWTRVKTLKITTPVVYIGLAVSSGTSGVLNTSSFSGVLVNP